MSTVAEKLQRKSQRQTPTKQVRLKLVYIDFWSAVKLSFLAAVALAIVTIVSFLLMYLVVQATGLIGMVDELLTSMNDGTWSLGDFLGLPQVLAFAAVVAILNLIVVTVLGAIAIELIRCEWWSFIGYAIACTEQTVPSAAKTISTCTVPHCVAASSPVSVVVPELQSHDVLPDVVPPEVVPSDVVPSDAVP